MATPAKSWNGFVTGERVIMLINTRGATADDIEIVYPPGTHAKIEAAVDFGEYQGKGVHLTIGHGDQTICNSFDDQDVEALGAMPFRRE